MHWERLVNKHRAMPWRAYGVRWKCNLIGTQIQLDVCGYLPYLDLGHIVVEIDL